VIFIWFIYGLAFFILGLAIIVYPKKGSAFTLGKHIWLVAVFGILHGINEWLDMFIVLETPLPPEILKFVRMATLAGSFLFLLWFGTKIIVEDKKKYRLLGTLPVGLFIIWAIVFMTSTQKLLIGDIWARYLLCAPGAFLTALALILQIHQFKEMKLYSVIRNLRAAAITFLCYAFLAGLVVKKASFFPASFLNYDLFLGAFGVPVQIFRAACAAVLAYSATKMLSIFRWETQETLHRSEQRCSTVASAVPVILFVQDSDSIITFIEGKGLDLLSLKAEDIIGRRISEVFSSAPQLAEDSRRALSGEEFGTTVTIDGVIFEFCYSPMRDNEGDVIGIIGVALDVTVKIQAQEELDTYRRQLEKNAHLAEVGTLGSVMAQRLDEPLSVTRLLLQRVLSEMGTASSEEVTTNTLKKSLAEISKASELVDKFRNTTQVSCETTAEAVDLYQIANRMMRVFGQRAQRANLRIVVKDIDSVPYMTITHHELEQIFFNLIQNAIDAADSSKEQKLTISCHKSEKEIELRFSDTCGGIEAEKLQNIFEPFSIAEPTVQKTGLGLAIAKQIIRAHGGNITAESQPHQGTTFYVTLPVEKIA
jgi:PAS domain S-box-containing protein